MKSILLLFISLYVFTCFSCIRENTYTEKRQKGDDICLLTSSAGKVCFSFSNNDIVPEKHDAFKAQAKHFNIAAAQPQIEKKQFLLYAKFHCLLSSFSNLREEAKLHFLSLHSGRKFLLQNRIFRI